MQRNTNQSVPNLSREELNTQLDVLRQREAAQRAEAKSRRTFVERVVLLLVALFGWMSGCRKPQPMCYRMPDKSRNNEPEPEPTCYEPALDPVEPATPETEEPEPAESEPAAEPASEPASEPKPSESESTNDASGAEPAPAK